ncbi:MAG: heme exporter protein CcmB [Pseudomonadota bacterium]
MREPTLRPVATFATVLSRELQLAYRRPADLLNPLFFFAVVTSLFPIAVSPLPEVLELIGPGVVWIAALLAALLPLSTHYAQDYEDGTLEHYLLSGQSLVAICIAKTVGLWLVAGLPLVLASLVVSGSYGLAPSTFGVMSITLASGSYALCALGAVAAALTVGVQRASALIALLVLPMMVPVLIFGTRAISLTATNMPAKGPIYLVLAVTLLAALLTPLATAAALRISME